MVKTLVVIPTKNRLVAMNVLLQNLIMQEGEFDIFIADMSDTIKLEDEWFFTSQIERLRLEGHKYYVAKVSGKNQLYGYQAALNYAIQNDYDLCLGSDDDITFSKDFIKKGIKIMTEHPECGILVGPTLIPVYSLDAQTVDPKYWELNPDFQGKLTDDPQFAHCIYVPPSKDIRECEQAYGAFFFRPRDALTVGGFPMYLSRHGFRGELMVQTAISFLGKKVWLNPDMITWHYADNKGGLREVVGTEKAKCIENDTKIWKIFYKQRKPSIRKEDYNFGEIL